MRARVRARAFVHACVRACVCVRYTFFLDLAKYGLLSLVDDISR